MTQKATTSEPLCSIRNSLAVVGERWSLLIVRDAFDGLSTFSEFKASLGVSSDILAARLNSLVEGGVLDRRPYRKEGGGRGSKERHSYHLTEAGRQLRVVLGALIEWGDANRPNGFGPPSVLVDAESERPVRLTFVDPDGNPVDIDRVKAIRGPGYNARGHSTAP
ncbi:helix-turn-helix domain-containing protein [Streptomyces chiangmaiensis]|uniref:winged helix-turn-helix transcriptional regulator n=1 Tax=Streptomyces chiangmaiensis TaxID=766497 RepID=UPI0031EDCF93